MNEICYFKQNRDLISYFKIAKWCYSEVFFHDKLKFFKFSGLNGFQHRGMTEIHLLSNSWFSDNKSLMLLHRIQYPSILLIVTIHKSLQVSNLNLKTSFSFSKVFDKNFAQKYRTPIFEEHLSLAALFLKKLHVESFFMQLPPIH